MGKIIDLTGQKFNRVTVIEAAGKDKWNSALWYCKCDCGKEKIIMGRSLRTGDTKSCGCFSNELRIALGRSCKGKKATEETKRKQSIARKGKKLSEEHKRKLSIAIKGKIRSEEHKRKISISHIGLHAGSKNPNWNPDREYINAINKTRNAMHHFIYKCLSRKSGHCEHILGYTPKDLKLHLELKFQEGMSWKNRSAWHIDHIKPIAQFVREGIYDPKIISALENLQPLWAEDNMKKQDKYEEAL